MEGLVLRQATQKSIPPASGAARRTFRAAMLVALLLAATAWRAHAQSTFGSIRGTVSDASGAVIPGAAVTVHSLEQNFDRQTTTSDAGEFLVENLQPGHYSVSVEHSGFSKAVVPDTELDARQELRLPVTLSLAAATTTIEVQAGAPQINTENGTVSNTLAEQDVTQLPMNSRAVSSSPLASLAISPSVVTDSQGNIAVGGATSSQVGFSVDGISTANVRSNGALHDAYPSAEGISETKVTAFNNNAEFAQIGDVTFTTKSGTNAFHGSAFEYFQNDVLDATIFNFDSKAPKNFNTFGGSLGGPVILPGLHALENRTFFFADYEGNRKTQSYPEELLVPTAGERAGNLSALVGSSGVPVNNPFTGTAYANNTITSISQTAQNLLAYYPLPNASGNGYNYQTLVPIPSNTNGWDLRVDETLTQKQSIYARFSWKDLMNSEGGSGLTANQFLPNVTAHDQNRSLLVSHSYTLRNNLVNEFRFGFTNFTENDSFPIEGSAAIAGLGLEGINISSHPTGDAFPTFSFSDGTFSTIGQDRTGTTISQTMEFTDNLIWTLGKHSLKFGLDARHVRYNALMFFQPSDDYGDFIFQPGLFTNYALGDLLLGLPQESFFAVTSPQINATSLQWGLYGQDEWQLSPHLTLNFGLRYELLPPFDESQGDLGSFDPRADNGIGAALVPDKFLASPTQSKNPAFQTVYTGFLDSFNACPLGNRALQCSGIETASEDHVTQGLRQLYKLDLDPRVSLAWRPFNNDKTVVRAGAGIFTQTTLGPMSFNNAGNPTSNLLTNVNAVSGANDGLAVVPAAFRFPQTSPSSSTVTLGGGSLEQANDPHFRDPQAAQWNLTVEHQVAPQTVVRVSYVGMANYRLPVTIDLNQIPASTIPWDTGATAGPFVDKRAPYQNWTLLMSSENFGHASYEAGIFEVEHRLSHGLLLNGNYTWAKNISDAQGSDAPTVFASEEAYAVEIANRFDLASDRGNVVATPRNRALISGTYALPFGPGQPWSGNRALNAALGGWEISTVSTLQSGNWLTPTTSPAFDQSNTGMAVRSGGGAILRPDCISSHYRSTAPGIFFNPAAFTETPAGAGRFGNCGVGILQGPGMIDVNSGLARNVTLHDNYKLRFEATFTNVLNRSNFAPPQTNISNTATFGALTSVLPQGLGGNRTGQLALRLDF
ncbi:MAG TPA: carboxypeptidase regulatory-like domain-containing protein [Acidobacteriaceae bacterium]|nr:carboxypeptidase regulatory-like domain-containing protein [Acidobacteriaceae bacterium]